MMVDDLMSTDVVTCDYEASVRTAVVRFLEEGVGSVIATREGEPVGIVTETDSLRAGASLKRPFEEIPLKNVLSHPLITTTGETPIREAVRTMKTNDIKKLPVVEGLDVTGIITLTDIAVNYSNIVREIHEQSENRERWEA
jgi:CBS domain-containing protein